jgi:hypothetical protein
MTGQLWCTSVGCLAFMDRPSFLSKIPCTCQAQQLVIQPVGGAATVGKLSVFIAL